MAGFLYYIPKERNPTREHLATLGFPFAARAGVPGGGCDKGPDSGMGTVFSLGPPANPAGDEPKIGHYPDRQTWYEGYDSAVWLGWETDSPPGPADLQVTRTITGRPTQLTDGNTWTLPTIRNMDGSPAVERVLGLGPNGRIGFGGPAPQYTALWGLIHRILDEARGTAQPTLDECLECVSSAMGLNYLVTKWELAALGVFTDANLLRVFGTIADIPALRDTEVRV